MTRGFVCGHCWVFWRPIAPSDSAEAPSAPDLRDLLFPVNRGLRLCVGVSLPLTAFSILHPPPNHHDEPFSLIIFAISKMLSFSEPIFPVLFLSIASPKAASLSLPTWLLSLMRSTVLPSVSS